MTTTVSPAFLPPEVIDLSLQGRTASDAIRELHRRLTMQVAFRDPDCLLRDLLTRQKLGANCLDRAMALAHARSRATERFVFALGRSAEGIFFDDEHPAIRVVFLVAAPSQAVADYLQWTVQLTRLLRQPAFRQSLLLVESEQTMKALWSIVIPPVR